MTVSRPPIPTPVRHCGKESADDSSHLFRAAVAAWLLIAAPLLAADGPEHCDLASGLGTHACTFPEGQIVIESDLVNWSVDRGGGLRTHALLLGDTLVHVGLKHGLEVEVGWVAYDRERTRLPSGGALRSSGVGDVTVGGKIQLVDPAYHPFGISFQPTLSIPTGALELGAQGLGGSALLAISYDLNDTVTVELTPRADVVGDRGDDDRHWEYGATAGIVWNLGAAINATIEYQRFRQEDPIFRRVTNVAALSFGWFPAERLQLSTGGGAGLDNRSPKLQLIASLAFHLK